MLRPNNLYLLALVTTALLFLFTACKTPEKVPTGNAYWRVNSTVSADAGSIGIQIEGPVGATWSAQIGEGASWSSFSLSDPTASTKGGSVHANANLNIVDIYFTRNDDMTERTATIAFTFAGTETPILLTLRQLGGNGGGGGGGNDHPNLHDWAELPVMSDIPEWIYRIHYAPMSDAANARTARNFTLCFDPSLHVALWVAYPMHSAYVTRQQGRTDDWAYDPTIEHDRQANIASGSYRGSYDRGHQIPSADRTNSYEMNAQTFYASNMTPQLGDLNQDMWANLETKVRNYICSDTLYVVTGCHFENTNSTTTDRDGMICPVPTHYYKVLLRTNAGNTGKRIADCEASELRAIGFWAEHRSYGDIQPPSTICTTVAEIEEKTGFTFFPQIADNAEQAVKAQRNPGQWGILTTL